MSATDPRDVPLHEAAARALDLVVALQPHGYGRDREAHAASVALLEREVAALRRARRPTPRPPLPAAHQIAQLLDLNGRHFARKREEIAGLLQGYIEALNARPRHAPQEVREAIARITRDPDSLLLQDADEAWRAFHAGSRKAAVVMAGATLEGVLQAAVARLGAPTDGAFRAVYPQRKAPAEADSYRFEEALSVLRHMGVLTSAVSHVARGIKELRNFVHPAVQKRQRGGVSDAQALLALQAVAALVEELAQRLDLD
ncbi:MAG: hypothetical protein M5U25_02190 [Planctomycetota bacterium]|nr:hypothetical protein [Planctomycetota bacterium]